MDLHLCIPYDLYLNYYDAQQITLFERLSNFATVCMEIENCLAFLLDASFPLTGISRSYLPFGLLWEFS